MSISYAINPEIERGSKMAFASVSKAAEKHPKVEEKLISYGTAGFRTKGSELDHVIFRMGILAVLRSKLKKATIGVMITASHNPEEDNGVKLVDPLGEMLEVAWEKHATELANIGDELLIDFLKKFVEAQHIDVHEKASVVFGRDTRPSSIKLAQALQDGIESVNGTYTDYSLLTTPQLHYMVRCINTNKSYGEPTEQGYYTKISQAFRLLHHNKGNGNYIPSITIDGANGVGALKIKLLQECLGDTFQLRMCNDGSKGKLNHQCGADFVKVQQTFPEGISVEAQAKFCSFDGDADRIVFFYQDFNRKFRLLDGDKIATLVAGYLQELVSRSNITVNLGLVQTAYANGSSTSYITEQLKVPVACVPTGVKHLHHKAQEFDIGVYFEANGHGTVLFSHSALEKIREATSSPNEQVRDAAEKLNATVNLINQTVGDAISDLLLVEVVLCHKGWGAEDWNQSYTDLPNRQCKVKVNDRTVIQTTDAERKVVSPAGLQTAIDNLVTKYPDARSFVRPSGTEDVVRVYAESNTQANADLLAYEVSVAVYDLAGGAGDVPKSPL